MFSTILAVGLVAAVAGVAAGEATHGVEIRQINTAARTIGCSRHIEQCAGATTMRTGLVVVDVRAPRLRHGPLSVVGMFHGAARPDHGLLASQMIAGGGGRLAVGEGWVQGGVGFAASQTAPGPKTIATTRAIMHGSPAVLLGVGAHASAYDVPFELTLDVGTSIDDRLSGDRLGRVYQITANVLVSQL